MSIEPTDQSMLEGEPTEGTNSKKVPTVVLGGRGAGPKIDSKKVPTGPVQGEIDSKKVPTGPMSAALPSDQVTPREGPSELLGGAAPIADVESTGTAEGEAEAAQGE